ncbi:phosphoribosylaminoimidazolesuccinocarboxamide synthase [Peptoanaerobacter stomatis]|uniref:Phosphoribosylaminoimidazole-succinocarboxamide synthase n=1 Tax=Peptoanaerobacter stomatis TaxID=796937 RepID=J5WAB8_9FIRM|nr:phosphoribosylaminoimidazolesuccinocarboxamide synthase [Peptoanaerobacter stomatis]EHL18176.1 phosphoribosylaminoimidazolesuccinocarboxamide synthase [Peptoanaerobacter stomatis]EJU20512.1 phosphoribosylaminoimidazolesuccinocarboxamide synthase [Peptoanaerobacter stomatis]NWO25267.1 phosphoribosylaminoimidazolesuccinocarboxamide synthase [Peptostreptococcaceae bacterium oral taxon 081]
MKKIYEGKTKTVYQLDDGNVKLFFKDDVTGKDGVFDPGENQVGLTIKDNGYYGLLMTKLMFEKIEQAGISTHYISANLDERTMTVKPVTVFGKGIEVICRLKATGSFIRRYGEYAKDGDILDYYVEVSLKDDEKGDPFISEELLEKFKILDKDEYKTLEKATKDITKIIQKTIEDKKLELIDIKLEFGRDKQGNIVLIDEISGGNMRVYKDGKSVKPIELSKILLDM